MVYLIRSAAYSDESDRFFHILKIGYTDDRNSSKRLSTYLLHNPTSKVLYSIPEANEVDENNLHQYFKRYRYGDYGRDTSIQKRS